MSLSGTPINPRRNVGEAGKICVFCWKYRQASRLLLLHSPRAAASCRAGTGINFGRGTKIAVTERCRSRS